MSVKINANIGTSSQKSSTDEEIRKLEIVENAGADAVMDLSTGKDIDDTRKKILQMPAFRLGQFLFTRPE